MQSNDNACGLFALAFAMAICSGQTPEVLRREADEKPFILILEDGDEAIPGKKTMY